MTHNVHAHAVTAVFTSAMIDGRMIEKQSADAVRGPIGKGYMVNVASDNHGVGHGDWTRITGWSESIVSYIQQLEARQAT